MIKEMQSVHYNKEIKFLSDPSRDRRETFNLIKQLNLFCDSEGLLQSKGRMEKCLSVHYDAVNPVLLHKDSYLTKLIILDAHKKCAHMGVSSTWNYLINGGYWIPKGRQAVSITLKECRVCKRMNANSFPYPSTPELPKDRVNLVNAFDNVGMDYTGSFTTNQNEKLYILIFTCLNTRAIHLEVVPNMTIQEFIMAFSIFQWSLRDTKSSLF